MFAGEPRKDIDDSFKAVCGVLDSIAVTSPQAQLYHEMLISLSDAVVKYRYRVSAEVRRTVQHYMDKILVIHPLRDTDDITQDYLNSEIANGDPDYQHANASVDPVSHANALDPGSSMGGLHPLPNTAWLKDLHCEWDDLDLQLSDDFVLDTEPFEKLFYSVE
jgi:hypothetical protein